MIKLDIYTEDYKHVKELYKEKLVKQHMSPTSFAQLYMSSGYSGGSMMKYIDKMANEYEAYSEDNTKEIWINPDEIKSIITMENAISADKYLKVTLKDNTVYRVKGTNVEEFMLKNIIFGNV